LLLGGQEAIRLESSKALNPVQLLTFRLPGFRAFQHPSLSSSQPPVASGQMPNIMK
jgi:hypothetical protein